MLLTQRLTEQGPGRLSGDGRCDNPGYNTKYLAYSLMNQETNEIIAILITQVTEVRNSDSMEKLGFQKTLNEVREKGIVVKQLTADRHMQIQKYLKEDEPQINNQFTKPLYKNRLNSLLATFVGHPGQEKTMSNFL